MSAKSMFSDGREGLSGVTFAEINTRIKPVAEVSAFSLSLMFFSTIKSFLNCQKAKKKKGEKGAD